MISLLLVLFQLLITVQLTEAQSDEAYVTSFVGTSTNGFSEGTGIAALFGYPSGIDIDSHGNLYVGDCYNNRIRQITPLGHVSTFAGSGAAGSSDGYGTYATLNFPRGLTVDASDNIWFSDQNNHLVRYIDKTTRQVTLFAGIVGSAGGIDGFRTSATFHQPYGIDIDSVTAKLYVADYIGNKVRRIVISTGIVDSLPGTYSNPSSVLVLPSNDVYITEAGNHRISKVSSALVYTALSPISSGGFADGPVSSAIFHYPAAMSLDRDGSILIGETSRIRRLNLQTNDVSTFIGGGSAAEGYGTSVSLYSWGVVYSPTNPNIYYSIDYAHCIKKIVTCTFPSTYDTSLNVCTCPAGRELQIHNGTCPACADGYFKSSVGIGSCSQCATNYQSSLDKTACTQCPSYQLRSIGMTTCQQCPLGTEINSNLTACNSCANGRVRSSLSDIVCTDCPLGFEPAQNKSVCVGCGSGYYRPNANYLVCLPCPAFATCNSSAVIGCQSGYMLNPSGDGCDQCPIGTQASADGSLCSSCVVGITYRSSLLQTTCQPCPLNSVCSSSSSFTCNAGFEPTSDGTGCQQCQAGYSKSASGNVACSQCAIGTESSANKQSCSPCLSGFYRSTTSYNKCIPCPTGATCSATAISRCPNGYKVNSNANGCDQCPTAEDSSDGINCIGCTGGYFKPDQSYQMCIKCPYGSSSCGGSAVTCQTGYYFDADVQCKRNDTYFSLFQTGTQTASTITNFSTITQCISTTSMFYTVSAKLPSSDSSAGLWNTATITVWAAQTVSPSTRDSTPREQAQSADSVTVEFIGTLPISPLMFGVVAFVTGIFVMLIFALVCCRMSLTRKNHDDFDGVTNTSLNTASQRTFTVSTMK